MSEGVGEDVADNPPGDEDDEGEDCGECGVCGVVKAWEMCFEER